MDGGVGEAALAAELAAGAPEVAAGTMSLGTAMAPHIASTGLASTLGSAFNSMGINPWSAALTGGSTIMRGIAQNDMQKRQQKLADAMTAYKLQKSQEGQQAISKYIDTIKPQADTAERSNEVSNLAASLNDSISGVRKYESAGKIGGDTGADYDARLSSNNETLAERLKRVISQLSVIGAPAQQDLARARRYGRAASDVSGANAAANNVGNVYMDAMGKQIADPYLSLGADVAQGLGLASALKRAAVI